MSAARILCLVILVTVINITKAQDDGIQSNEEGYRYEEPPINGEDVNNNKNRATLTHRKKTYLSRMEIDPNTGEAIYVWYPANVEENEDDGSDKVHFRYDSEERANDIKEQLAAYEEQKRNQQNKAANNKNLEGSTVAPKGVIDVPKNNACPSGQMPDAKGVCRSLWRMAFV